MVTRTVTALACMYMISAAGIAAPDPAITDDAVNMVLSVKDNGTNTFWELEYGKARHRALEYLKAGQRQKALEAAMMQYMLCPLEPESIDMAIASVQQMLVAIDGNDTRATQFGQYARLGAAGLDGEGGTADDLANPVDTIALADIERSQEYYAEYDRILDERAAVSATWETAWYETEKAFARLNGGDFDGAAVILAAALFDVATVNFAPAGVETRDPWRRPDVMNRMQAGLGVVYRSRTGTLAGVEEFIQTCTEYAQYGPPGADNVMGTHDDLKPPM